MVNALLCMNKSDCHWRLLPRAFPPYALCNYYFRRWQADGRGTVLNQDLVRRRRQRTAPSCQAPPSVAIPDAQSV